MKNYNEKSNFIEFLSQALSKIILPLKHKLEIELKKLYISAINENPKDSDAYNNLGILNYEFGNLEQSLKDLSKAISISRQYHHHIHYFCSSIYTYLGHINYINKHYLKAVENYNEAIFQDHQNDEAVSCKKIIQNSMIRSNPPRIDLKTLVDSEYFKKIILDFDFAQISNLKFKNLFHVLTKEKTGLSEALYKADYLYQKNYFKEVIKLSKKAMAQYNNKIFLYYIACCYFHLKKHQLSEKYFSQFIQIDPKSELANYDFCLCLIHNKKYLKAKQILKKIIDRNPKNEFAIFAFGLCNFFQQRYKTAYILFQQSLSIAKEKHEAYHQNCSNQFYNRAYVYYLDKNYDLAITDLIKSLDLYSKNTDALLLRVNIYLMKNNYLDAQNDINDLLKIDPYNNEAKLIINKVKLMKHAD